MHLTKREQKGGYLEVTDSESFCQFGNDDMHTPGPRAKLEGRKFYHLNDDDILSKASEVRHY